MISICPRQPDNNNNSSTQLSINTNQPPATPLATNPLCEGQYLQFDKEERKIETHTHTHTNKDIKDSSYARAIQNYKSSIPKGNSHQLSHTHTHPPAASGSVCDVRKDVCELCNCATVV